MRVRAIATAWRCPAESSDSGVRTDGIRSVRSRRIPRATCSMRPSSRSAPSVQLAAEEDVRRHVEVGAQREVLEDGRDAQRVRRRRRRDRRAPRRRSRSGPESGASTPEMTLASVDLPAPLSPTSATTSCACTSRSTPTSASTAPNRRVICRSDSSGTRGLALMHLTCSSVGHVPAVKPRPVSCVNRRPPSAPVSARLLVGADHEVGRPQRQLQRADHLGPLPELGRHHLERRDLVEQHPVPDRLTQRSQQHAPRSRRARRRRRCTAG